MQVADIYKQMLLENGVEIIITDLTRSYFGDYHLVRLEITCRADARACSCGGETANTSPVQGAEYRRIVEKMGVPSAEVETARESLVRDFLNNSLAYLSSPDFPAKLAGAVSRQLKKAQPSYAEIKS